MNHRTAGAATLAQKKTALVRFLVVVLSSVKKLDMYNTRPRTSVAFWASVNE